jgi:hypothetical protein
VQEEVFEGYVTFLVNEKTTWIGGFLARKTRRGLEQFNEDLKKEVGRRLIERK